MYASVGGFRGAGFANYVHGDVGRRTEACSRLVIVGQFLHFFIPYENERMRFGIASVVGFNEKRFHLCDGRAVFKIAIDNAADTFAFDERKCGPARHC
jgi:hypothetical protein